MSDGTRNSTKLAGSPAMPPTDATPSRRSFIGTTVAAAGAMTFGLPNILSGRNLNEKLNIAIIGAGGRGGANMHSVSMDANIVALVDVDEGNLSVASAQFPKARKERDFRRLFEHHKEFDAVVVSTCEHTHAFATLPALQLNKHVYCEKPLTYNIAEARVIREQAARSNVATQMGTQIHAGNNYRRVVELVQSGAIGKVSEAHVWVSRAWGWQESAEVAKQNNDIVVSLDRPQETQQIPAHLDWDLWLGPAPARPYNEIYFPGPKWYRWWDFGNGTMSDLGSHWIDLSFWALNLNAPLTIEASGPPPHPEIAPASMQVEYQYAARGEMPPVKVSWYQGANKPQLWKDKSIPQWSSGTLFVGDQGMLLANYGDHVLLPEETFADFKRPEPTIPDSIGHHAEWLLACKTGSPTTCNFDYAGRLTEANHLGNVAYRTGQKIEWDTKKMEVTNTAAAEPFIRRDYRKGWSL